MRENSAKMWRMANGLAHCRGNGNVVPAFSSVYGFILVIPCRNRKAHCQGEPLRTVWNTAIEWINRYCTSEFLGAAPLDVTLRYYGSSHPHHITCVIFVEELALQPAV